MGSICCNSSTPILIEKVPTYQSFSPSHSSIPPLPRNLDPFDEVYTLSKEKLGFGAYGDVKMCVHTKLNLTRAAKIIFKDHLERINLSPNWFSEKISIISKLDHPLIIKSHEYFEDRDYFYLIMEYHEEGDLFKYFKQRKQLEEKSAKEIIHQLLVALEYLHKNKIAHRDIKLENILISEKRGISIKLIDFDTAALFDETRLTGNQGTLHYMAPETLSKDYDEKCDIWSSGVIMYNLITGKGCLPGLSQGHNPAKVNRVNIDFSLPVFKSISPDSLDLLRKMLQKDPKKRISAKQALTHKWFEDLAGFNGKKLKFDLKQESKGLREESKKERLEKAYLPCYQHFLDEAEKLFLQLDKDFDGVVSVDDIMEFCLASHSRNEAYEILEVFLKNRESGERIRFSEFLVGFMDLRLLEEMV